MNVRTGQIQEHISDLNKIQDQINEEGLFIIIDC